MPSTVDAVPAPVAPWQIPARARRPRLRHVIDTGCAPGLAAQYPRQRHPSAAPQIRSARSPRRHRPNMSAGAGNCSRPAATACAGRSRSARVRHCAADGEAPLAQSGQCETPANGALNGSAGSRAAIMCAVWQGSERGTQGCRYLRHTCANIARFRRQCSQGLWTVTGQYGYRFDNAWMTESCSVVLGPLPSLRWGAWGKEPN